MLSRAQGEAQSRAQYGVVCTFDYSNWAKGRFIMTCADHNTEFTTTATTHLQRSGCKPGMCELKLLPETTLIIADFKRKYGSLWFDYSLARRVTKSSKMKIHCNEHDIPFEQTVDRHTKNPGCTQCEIERNTQNYIVRAVAIHGNKYGYEFVVCISRDIKIILYCNKCHVLFEIRMDAHIAKTNPQGCAKCGTDSMADQRRLKPEEFIERARIIHMAAPYGYDLVIYRGYEVKVIIYCPRCDKTFDQTPHNHLDGKGCMDCGFKRTGDAQRHNREDFIISAYMVHGDKYIYDLVVYERSDKHVIIICPIHGEFSMSPDNHLQNRGCKQCGVCCRADKCRYTLAEVIEKFIDYHGDKYDYSKVVYKNAFTYVIITCNTHKVDFQQVPVAHWFGQGCPHCAVVDRANTFRAKYGALFIERARIVHGLTYIYDLTVYINNYTKVIIECPCGHRFEQAPFSHLGGHGCPDCVNKTESKLLEWLKHTYPDGGVITQAKFHECRNDRGNKVIYDFLLYDSIAIELDGAQHFMQVSNWSPPEENLANDTLKAISITSSTNGRNYNLIRIYQPWVFKDTHMWRMRLDCAINFIRRHATKGLTLYIGGDVYNEHKSAYIIACEEARAAAYKTAIENAVIELDDESGDDTSD